MFDENQHLANFNSDTRERISLEKNGYNKTNNYAESNIGDLDEPITIMPELNIY